MDEHGLKSQHFMQPDVFGQLHEVLACDRLAAVVLAVGQVQNGRGFVG
jgi:hypothetical protein